MAHFGVPDWRRSYCFEPFQIAMDDANVYCESAWCLQSRIVEFAKDLPRHKILYGSDTPPNEPGMWIRLLEVLCHEPPQGMNLSEDDLAEEYLGNNLAKMLGIEPDPAAARHDGSRGAPRRTPMPASRARRRRSRRKT